MTTAADTILAHERRGLDRWAAGDPLGYLQIFADDATYFDDIAAHRGIHGRPAMEQYFHQLADKIPAHRYNLADINVQVYGDTAILMLRYEPSALDGKPLTTWKATSVYRRMGTEWRVVHAHWSMVKEA